MGKTLIAEAAVFEALHTRRRAFYTTPLIALTEQKYYELQESAVRWGFSADDVGLVTGNRHVNAEAPILVVVAEILFNRLLRPDLFPMDEVSSVVMDEFHSFNDPERGVVWELSLGLLPKHVRTLLLSATVGNSMEFVQWLRRSHDRKLELVQSRDRKVPLTYQWVGDALLNEHIEWMASGNDEERKTPALIFCFNRDECWNVAEQLKGKQLIDADQKRALVQALEAFDFRLGAGAKLKQLLMRGVGVHHAGILPQYKRIVEELFQQKLLAVTVCTETLAAGINLPARSVVLPQLLKGPPGEKKLMDASSAHQIFGRAGRPQYDTQGYIFALAHDDDVKIMRWREKYDQIPEDTKDPQLRKAKKALKKKMPSRRATQQYWEESHFEKLRGADAAKLSSKGSLPWRHLAHMLDVSAEVEPIRELVGKRLLQGKRMENAKRDLDRMLMTLWKAGYVTLEPEPPKTVDEETTPPASEPAPTVQPLIAVAESTEHRQKDTPQTDSPEAERPTYRPTHAHPTDQLERILMFRGVNPLYGVFLANHLGIADRAERLQAWESLLEMPGSVARLVRVPSFEELPPGPLATQRLDIHLLQLGLASAEELGQVTDEEEEYDPYAERVWPLTLADKLRRWFDYDFPGVTDVRTVPVWAAGEIIEYGDFNKFITSRGVQKQEGVLFRHLLRLILLIQEFAQITPPDVTEDEWLTDLDDITDRLATICRAVDATSTDKALEEVKKSE